MTSNAYLKIHSNNLLLIGCDNFTMIMGSSEMYTLISGLCFKRVWKSLIACIHHMTLQKWNPRVTFIPWHENYKTLT